MNNGFYKGRKVLITGHTGFKGSWMCMVLANLGADVIGYSLKPPTSPSLFEIAEIAEMINDVRGDIRDLERINKVLDDSNPEIIIHMAAQPLVRESYLNPVYTYDTNVMGTVNIMETIRLHESVKSFINVTTDKVYQNNEWEWGYREIDPLNGFDPYSNSKSCSELVTDSFKKSFFDDRNTAISTCRAGNVIGGGDFATDRIIPDCIRAVENDDPIIVRNPNSTRPYQHVLEPICVYLKLAALQYNNKEKYAGSYNIGPDDCDCVTTGDLVSLFCTTWGTEVRWENISKENEPHEAGFLKLDNSKIKRVMKWTPKWHIKEAVEKTVEWSKAYLSGKDVNFVMKQQISEFLK